MAQAVAGYRMKKIAFNLKCFLAFALVALLSGAPTMTRFAAQAQLCVIVSLHLQYEVQAGPRPAVCVVDNQMDAHCTATFVQCDVRVSRF